MCPTANVAWMERSWRIAIQVLRPHPGFRSSACIIVSDPFFLFWENRDSPWWHHSRFLRNGAFLGHKTRRRLRPRVAFGRHPVAQVEKLAHVVGIEFFLATHVEARWNIGQVII